MGIFAPSTATSNNTQASNNNAGQGGDIYFNLTHSKVGGGSSLAHVASKPTDGTGAGAANTNMDANSGIRVSQTDHATVDKAFGLAEMALMESFNSSRGMRQADTMALSTMQDQVKTAAQSDGGEGERMLRMGAVLIGVVMVASFIFGGRKRGNV